MAPKFRGNSDDWLDNQRLRNKQSASKKHLKKANTSKSTDLPLDQSNAVVAEVFPNQCRVKLDLDQTEILCSYRRSSVMGKANVDYIERSPVAVGDRVLASALNPQSGTIEGLSIRKNSLFRLAPGRDGQSVYHVLAANVDLIVIVASADQPEFTFGLIDRFLVAAESQKIPCLICISKMDLWPPSGPSPECPEKPWQVYQDIGYSFIEISKESLKVKELEPLLFGKTVVFCGQSGVGKTSLLRTLIGKDFGKVGEVNAHTGKGRHTTTTAVLLKGPEKSHWIDTPGVKEFGLIGVSQEELAFLFPEFKGVTCSISSCLHLDEAGCQVQGFVRYPSYRKILISLNSSNQSGHSKNSNKNK